MNFTATDIAGAFLVAPDLQRDERGHFGRTWCEAEFRNHGLNPQLTQCNISHSLRRGTLRGMHYQTAPYAEAKLIRVTRGKVYDVLLDLRHDTPGFGKWQAFELDGSGNTMLYAPEGVAHGFQTLCDDTELFYQMSAPYSAGHAAAVRWNDPAFQIHWPLENPILSPRDQQHPLWTTRPISGDLT